MRKTPILTVLGALFFVSVPAISSASTNQYTLTQSSLMGEQPGMAALTQMDEQNLNTEGQVLEVVSKLKKSSTYKRMLSKLSKAETDEAAAVLMALANGESLESSIPVLAQNDAYTSSALVRAAMLLFPLDRYELYRDLQKAKVFDQAKLRKWASSTGVLTSALYPSSMTDQDVFIQPLLESASITVQHQPKDARILVSYKAAGSNDEWQQARELVFEPVTGVHTGPMVYLDAGTRYDVKIKVTTQQGDIAHLTQQFTTRADKPPIDPNKVYHLADFYKGGTLDLEALKIEGSADGWAKIVGDKDTVIEATEGNRHAISIGNNSYIYFENITVRGGRTHSIYADQAHHIWINQCDIAEWGREPNIIKKGVAYEKEGAEPINYDSAIYLRQSGVVTVENCHVHDPIPFSNDWRYGHPKGPNAFFAHANHPDPQYKGQVVIRNNRFEGKPGHRFNDVIEGRKNSEPLGGFVRDAAIYNNTFAYGNDDAIEVDGGQYNVMVYNNDMSHTYTGVSVIPTRIGPSFVFNNYIHDLGDETGKQWAGIKMGGLLAGAYGKSYLFHNLIEVNRNGFTASRFQEDSSLLTHAQNNIVITFKDNKTVGYNLFDQEGFAGSTFVNNYLINMKRAAPKIMGSITVPYAFPELVNTQKAQELVDSGEQVTLPIDGQYRIPNFSHVTADGKNFIYGIVK